MDLDKMSLAELKSQAKELGIKNIGRYKKAELAVLIASLLPKTPVPEEAPQKKPHKKKDAPVKASVGETTIPGITPPPEEPPASPVLDPPPTSQPDAPQEFNPQPSVSEDIIETPTRPISIPQEQQQTAEGILEILPDGFGFLRVNNFLPSSGDIYISPTQIRRFNLRTGDLVCGTTRHGGADKFSALSFIQHVNNEPPYMATRRTYFEYLTPIFPTKRITLESPNEKAARHQLAPRIIDLLSPIGFGQRGMIVSPPKAGKTVLLSQIANSITRNHPNVHLIVLLIDERPEEVTDMQRSIIGEHCTVVYSTFDEQPENHKRVAEMVLERAKRLVEQKKDLVVLLDSITRLGRAYNLTIPAGGRTLSGGLDPAALYMPKKFFGAARNVEEGGSLTVLATALVDTGSKMDDVIFEEFKGTGNMELVLDRRMAERRVFPAIDIIKSGTRRDDLLLTSREIDAMYTLREMSGRISSAEFSEKVTDMLIKSHDNREFIDGFKDMKRI